MSAKSFNFLPEVTNSSVRGDKVFKDITAVAIPILQGEKVSVKKSELVKLLTAYTKIDLTIELANWPDFSAKAGEIIEILLLIDSLTRIYLVGIGEGVDEDIRKASSALSRKVKGTQSKVLSGLVDDTKQIDTHVAALILANYQFSMKSEKKSKKPSFVIYGDLS